MSACLPLSARDLRHDRAVADGKSEGTGPRLRISAWLPPGLALGWLAVLATFIHSVGYLITAWAATVSLTLLLAWRRPASTGSPPETVNNPVQPRGRVVPAPVSPSTGSTSRAESDTALGLASSGLVSGPTSKTGIQGAAEAAVMPELRVLTAAEVASVLRVDTDVVILAIRNGELPGNRVGDHWRVDASALARWLQGAYRHPLGGSR
jgi:excisionase family DNA binding protein